MKVKELIQFLNSQDPELEVVIHYDGDARLVAGAAYLVDDFEWFNTKKETTENFRAIALGSRTDIENEVRGQFIYVFQDM